MVTLASTVGTKKHRRGKGFRAASTLVSRNIREAGESRGFAVSRVLTHWQEIVGPDLAEQTRPVDVRYGRSGIGATLTILTTGAMAPLVQMQSERIRERVNACYGYSAISQVKITQTAAQGFAEGQASFEPAPAQKVSHGPNQEMRAKGETLAGDVKDEGLQDALADLAANVLTKTGKPKGFK